MSTLKANRIENLTTTDGGININNSGNVGIGTTSPGDVLTVAGTNAFIKVDRSNGNPGIDFRYDGSTTNRGVIDVTSAGALRIAAGGNTERLRIDSSGRVGIGTSAPDTKVHVVGSLKVENTSGTGNAWTYYKNADRTYLVGVRGSGSDALSFYDLTADAERMRIDTSGRVGIGTSSPSFELQVSQSGSASEIAATSNVTSGTASRLLLGNSVGTARATFNLTGGGSELAYLGTEGNFPMYFQTNGAERMRIDSSGRVGIGTSSPGNPLHIADQNPSIRLQSNSGSYQGRNTLGQYNNILYLECDNDNAVANSAMAFTVDASEAMRITNDGHLLVAKSNTAFETQGHLLGAGGSVDHTRDGAPIMYLNRTSSDGELIKFYQATSLEGSISVSGSTVSYNGGHLTRWSQLASGAERTEILRGSVLSNLDEMCEWGEEDNEQLNRMKVSDVEGDVNVAGVFQAWDDDDDTYTNDFYCAMTGDFVIRIAQGTTVARGDLLMSAGDGTAKPQDDDIVRSKTIAKVTSTTVSTTYSDGSYCVPCVLMAC